MTTPLLPGAQRVRLRIAINLFGADQWSVYDKEFVSLSLWALHALDSFNQYVLYLPPMGLRSLYAPFDLPGWVLLPSRFPAGCSKASLWLQQFFFILAVSSVDLDVLHFVDFQGPLSLLRIIGHRSPPVVLSFLDRESPPRRFPPLSPPFSFVTTLSEKTRQIMVEDAGWAPDRVRILPWTAPKDESEFRLIARTWLALYRRAFAEAVARFTGWDQTPADQDH
ncbi:MAG: hypothetical protein NZ959_09515 [Armatimonadetes bacterium]|nr:hypothetical protein [Armatimonadota bacterium]MDW8122729.1 hypothetical protein [Armatimonadota bacterium]